ncbi:MAG: energy-coupling factor ABC transporter ATP-binding protein [Christensenellaceae bacterium]|jgi:cobalt/nickel transport system ATP-binding protein|nr:energy-coupling factor ABC transporter ATP-binding protein [Christensenellaceae bacterium]
MLSVNDLSVKYPDGNRVLKSINFALESGESVAVVGANSAGKTTLLLAVVGVLGAETGTVSLNGLTLNKKNLAHFRKIIGLVFQNPDDQLFMPNVYEDVAFGPRNLKYTEAKTRECVEEALSQLEISHLSSRSPFKLSGGEKRLAAIATVLSMQPDFLLFDEPTAYLDPCAKRNLKNVINGLPQGKLIATHDLSFAAETCSRVIILKEGKIIADDAVACLKDTALLENAGL